MEVAGIKPLDAEAQAVHGPDLGSPVPIQLLLKDRILTSLVGRLLLVLSGADQERGTWLQVRLVVGRLLLTRGGGWGGEDGGGATYWTGAPERPCRSAELGSSPRITVEVANYASAGEPQIFPQVSRHCSTSASPKKRASCLKAAQVGCSGEV